MCSSDLFWIFSFVFVIAVAINAIFPTATQLQVPQWDDFQTILWQLRFPRLMCGALCGALLGLSGVLSQSLFRNPLASPNVIGISSGAACGAAAITYFGLAETFGLQLAAAGGAFIATLCLLGLQRREFGTERLLLAGVALGGFFSALSALWVHLHFEEHQRVSQLLFWLLGAIDAKSWSTLLIVALLLSVLAGLALQRGLKMDLYTFGDDLAQTSGVDVWRLRRFMVALIAIAEGTVMSLAGALSFVSLVVPHCTRLLIGGSHRALLASSMVNGATLVLLADALARCVRFPAELQTGVVLALIGSPFFLYLVLRREDF